MIIKDLLCISYHDTIKREINEDFDNFHIYSQTIIKENNKPELFEDPMKTLMKRPECAHLTYDQQLLIYQHYQIEGKFLSKIWQKFGMSIFTGRRIIKRYSSNIERGNIFQKIRWTKIINSPAAVKWISKYVWAQPRRFISADAQAYIKEQLLITIPLHQIRKNLKEKLRMSF